MLSYILGQWKRKKYILVILICCYIISGLLLAIGIGISEENYKMIKDSTSGNTDIQLIVYLRDNGGNIEDMGSFVLGFEKYGEVQVLNLPSLELRNEIKAYPVAVCFEKKETWHIPLVEGTYLDTVPNGIVIGKKIAENTSLKLGDHIIIKGVDVEVSGIAGRNNRGTQWDDTIYMKYDTYIKMTGCIDSNRRGILTLLLKSGKDSFIKDFFEIEEELNRKGISIYYQEVKDNFGYSSVANSIIMTVTGFAVLSVIIITNTINIMYYWFMERKHDIAVIKSMGADNNYLFKWLVIELIMLMSISEFLANMIFLILYLANGFKLPGNVNIALSPFHILMSIIAIFVMGFLIACILNKKSIFSDPNEILKNF